MKPIHLDAPQRKEWLERRRQTHDQRIFERLSAVLWAAEGKPRGDIADLLGRSVRPIGQWLRLFRITGVEGLCTIPSKGDPGKLTAAPVATRKGEIKSGRFHNSDQIHAWVEDTWGVTYSSSGVKDRLRRIGASYHKVTGCLGKGNPDNQKSFLKKYQRHQRAVAAAGHQVRRYGVDACHPIWGLELVYYCWLMVGHEFLVGVGDGRQRLHSLGAYCPADQEHLDIRRTRDNINGEQVVHRLRWINERHPEAVKIILYVDGARSYAKPVVKEWRKRHPAFRWVTRPACSPNLNVIERLWKLLRRRALSRWHKTFAEMQDAVSSVWDHLSDYRAELETLMREEFPMVRRAERPESGVA